MSFAQRLETYGLLMRLHHPVGIALLWLPCMWGLSLVYAGLAPLKETLIFTVGAVLMRSAGCIYNDLVDRNFDGKVARTRTRPIAAGLVESKEAWILIGTLSLTAFGLLLMLPPKAIAIGIASIALVAFYPWMKRITYWPQLFLGFTFNWGILLSWFCVHENLSPAVISLYCAGIFWTLYYDTIYAFQDIEDDILIGVRSTARRFRHTPFNFLRAMAGLMCGCLLATGALENLSFSYFVVIIGLMFGFHYQLKNLDLKNTENCATAFKVNAGFGGLIWLALVLGARF